MIDTQEQGDWMEEVPLDLGLFTKLQKDNISNPIKFNLEEFKKEIDNCFFGKFKEPSNIMINIAYLINMSDEEFINCHKNPSDYVSFMGSLKQLDEYNKRKLKLKID